MNWFKCFQCRLKMWFRLRRFKFPLTNDDIEIMSGLINLKYQQIKLAAKGGKKGFYRRLCKKLKQC